MELFNLKDHSEKVSFSQAVVKGIGRDQGLFFPDHIEPLTNIDELLDLPLAERSAKILRHLIGDEIPEAEKAGMTLIPVKRYFDAFEVIFGPAPGCAA